MMVKVSSALTKESHEFLLKISRWLILFLILLRRLTAVHTMDVNTGNDDDVSFHLGEMFDSYEELEQKLDRFSKHSLVHYWRRDSRTVSGAHMKTARPISERLKYYSVKYACIYGGQKFLPRGAGRRQSQLVFYFLKDIYP